MIRQPERDFRFLSAMRPAEMECPVSAVSACEAYPWFAVRVRSNHERVTQAHLRGRGYEEFTPTYRSERRWSDRTRKIDQALFPGYVFCRFDPEDRLPILTVPGVVGLVSFGKVPAPIPVGESERIRRMVQSGLSISPWPFLDVGQPVSIERGPLAGVEGVLAEVKGKGRLIVSINLLRRSVSAEVERNWVSPVRAGLSTSAGMDALHFEKAP